MMQYLGYASPGGTQTCVAGTPAWYQPIHKGWALDFWRAPVSCLLCGSNLPKCGLISDFWWCGVRPPLWDVERTQK